MVLCLVQQFDKIIIAEITVSSASVGINIEFIQHTGTASVLYFIKDH